MSRSFTYDGATDLTAATRLASFSFTCAAYRGEVGDGGFDYDDPASAADLVGLRPFTAEESEATPALFFSGFIADRGIGRGPFRTDGDRQWAVSVVDINSSLDDILLRTDDANRPAETDVARVTWLVGSGALPGVGASFVSSDDPVYLDPSDYRSRHARDVLDECAEAAGKNFFLRDDGSGPNLHYRLTTDITADPATGSISTDPADLSSTCYGPSWEDAPALQRDPTRVYSGVEVSYTDASGQPQTVFVENGTTLSTYRQREQSLYDSAATTAEGATQIAQQFLEAASTEEDQVEVPVKLPRSALGLYLEGQYVTTNFAHLGGAIGYNISRKTVAPTESPDIYLVTLILTVPVKITRFGGRGSAPAGGLGGTSTTCVYERWAGSESVWTVLSGDPDWITFGSGALIQTTDNDPGGDNILYRFVDSGDHPAFRQPITISGSFIADALPAPNINSGLHMTMGIEWQDTPGGTGGSVQVLFDVAWNDTESRYESGVSIDSGGGTDDDALFIGTATSSVLGIYYSLSLGDSGITASVRDLNSTDTLSLSGVSGGAATPADSTGYVKLVASMSNGDLPEGTVHSLAIGVLDITGPTPAPWCSTGTGAGTQSVPFYIAAISDGSTTSYTTFYPYVQDTLRVLVDGIDWTNSIVQTDPSTGAWAFTLAPATDDIIRVSYVRAA